MDREQFIIVKMSEPTVWRICLKNLVGMISRVQEVEFIREIVSSKIGIEIC